MPLPHLHIFHPQQQHLAPWFAEVESLMRADANWDECVRSRTEYNQQAAFDVPTAVGRIRRQPGPVIFLQKVQRALFETFRRRVSREMSVYLIDPTCAADIWQACEEARIAFDAGEPRISRRELIAYLIVAKLARMDMWGGTSLNKNLGL
jgi:hypothetical protein